MIAEGEFVKAERLVSGALRILDDGDEKALLRRNLGPKNSGTGRCEKAAHLSERRATCLNRGFENGSESGSPQLKKKDRREKGADSKTPSAQTGRSALLRMRSGFYLLLECETRRIRHPTTRFVSA